MKSLLNCILKINYCTQFYFLILNRILIKFLLTTVLHISNCITQYSTNYKSKIIIVEFAVIIRKLVGGNNKIEMVNAVEDDPQRRKPDITRAVTFLNWKPKVNNSCEEHHYF